MVDVAGPLCFQGDYQARDVELPLPSDGDILAIHDTGAYTMSMYCRYPFFKLFVCSNSTN